MHRAPTEWFSNTILQLSEIMHKQKLRFLMDDLSFIFMALLYDTKYQSIYKGGLIQQRSFFMRMGIIMWRNNII